MPMEATGVISSIAGISELAKEAFAKQADAKPTARGNPPPLGR